MKSIFVIGDAPVTPTGFSTVILNIFKHFDKKQFDVHQLGINYFGDPHEFPWKIYPASAPIGGNSDIWGIGRIKQFVRLPFNSIFILNDLWVIVKYLKELKIHCGKEKLPPIIVYFPVDAKEFLPEWFEDFDIVTKVIVYTQFAKDVVQKACPDLDVEIIPHGINREDFYKMNVPREEIKKILFPNTEEFYNSFIVLNANRNQPRKRIDLTIESFSLFAKDKPENVKLYLHMGLKDAGFDIGQLVKRHGIEDRLIITNRSPGIQVIPTSRLNLIYNACDVGINTSLGEGWGLVNFEHAVTGAPQVVPDHSACSEIFDDCGLLAPVNQYITNQDTLTVSGLVRPSDVAERLELLYQNKKLYDELAEKSVTKFTSLEYDWKNISKNIQEIIESTLS